MDARRESDPTPMKNRTTVERKSERELVVTRTFDAPGAPRVRGVDQARAVQAVVDAEVDGHDPAVLRDGCARRGRVSARVRTRRRWRSSARTSK